MRLTKAEKKLARLIIKDLRRENPSIIFKLNYRNILDYL
jgi:hypothetical protein